MIPYKLLPEEFYNLAFIAGGYAACPALATDCDVWVFLDGGIYNLADGRNRILAHLQTNGFYPREENAPEEFEYSGVKVTILKVAYVHWGDQKYHLMVVDGPVAAVLENFDVSTHQLALTSRGVVLGPNWTPITAPPVKLLDTPNTDARMVKISVRYAQ